MGISNATQVGGFSVGSIITPVITAGAYSANAQVGGIQTLVSACQNAGAISTLMGITVVDKASQSAALIVYFFNQLPVVASTDGVALNISDAEMAAKFCGAVTIANGDYVTTSANSAATKNLPNTAIAMRCLEAGGNLYAVVKTTGTPTYGSTSDLVFSYTFGQDL